ncbi:FUSC family protein [Ferroacidibacillus organovorans]|uniref:Integral membrane bound transporter domain-containing protein n=1 Tax=Ferroacidibacillus organovorans TaxID=1765683 RepID=A0A853KDK8_9BACL|nr:FUSC family protein [Ferroacidibacillus organovorans]KYP81345.1 hypothetical protein AYJ22_00840 [Ferroacidibacillus organovorans]OAG95132.1 hypothetical protein AYW79_01440 [Ferroacidibacillus organovorans]
MKRREIPALLDLIMSHDRSSLHVQAGLRNALGIALPLAVGLISGQVQTSIVVAIGALVTGFAGVTGTSRLRLRTMLLAFGWLGVATFIGTLSGHFLIASGVLLMANGFFAGILVAVSPAAAQVGMLATQSMIIFMAFPAAPLHALFQALLVMLGSFTQISLMWVQDRFAPLREESIGVSRVFRAVGHFVASRTRISELAVVQALVYAETQLNDSRLPGSSWRKLRILLDEIEHVRNAVVALNRSFRLLEEGDPKAMRDAGLWRSSFYSELSASIDAFAEAVLNRQMLPEHSLAQAIFAEDLYTRFEHRATEVGDRTIERVIAQLIEHISACLERIDAVMRQGAPQNLNAKLPTSHPTFWQPIRTLFATVRANFTWQSAALRHAIRVSCTLGIAFVFYRLIPLPRGYWVPLTALLILKPDFFSTVSRSLARVVGTAIGVVVTTALIAIPQPAPFFSVIWIIVFAVLLYTVFNYNYLLFSVFITSEIVVLLSFFEHMAPILAVRDRLLDTMIGSAFALIAFSLWPTWQLTNVPNALGNFLRADRRYLRAVFQQMRDRDDNRLLTSDARKAVRLARTNAMAVVEQMVNEPRRGVLDRASVSGFLMALHRFVDNLLALETGMRALRSENHSKSDLSLIHQDFGDFLVVIMEDMEVLVRASLSAQPDREDVLSMMAQRLAFASPQWIEQEWQDPYLRNIAQRLLGNVGTMIRMMPLDQASE